MLLIADVTDADFGRVVYEPVLADDEFNLVVLLLSAMAARDVFADYDDDPDYCDALLAGAIEGLQAAVDYA